MVLSNNETILNNSLNFLFLLWLNLGSGVAMANLSFSSIPVLCIFFSHSSYLHVLSHHIHPSPLRSFSFSNACKLHLEYPSTNVLVVVCLNMSKPYEPGISYFVFS